MRQLDVRVVIATLSVLAAAWLPLAPAAEAGACATPTMVPGQGWSCPVAGGFDVLLADGTTVRTHGPDGPRPDHGGSGAGLDVAPAPPACAVAGGPVSHLVVLYARPFDVQDRHPGIQTPIRTFINDTNGLWRDAGLPFGVETNLRFRCEGGLVTVLSVELPTPAGDDSFGTILSDLRALGFTDTSLKYVVWYDDTVASGVHGQATVHVDDRLVATNLNNGGPGANASFAVIYQHYDQRTLLHELAHVMGAVQPSAPHATGAWHCNDGRDTLCYNDYGPTANYSHVVCPGDERFDCGNDDYFHPSPPGGNYLASHWNLASTLNRFIRFGSGGGNIAPVPSFTVSCAGPACTFDGRSSTDADGHIAGYVWDFGDGNASSAAVVTHQYASPGPRVVTLTVTDNVGASGVVSRTVNVPPDTVPPVTTVSLLGSAGQAEWFRTAVRVRLDAVDAGIGVAGTWLRIDGGPWVAYTSPPLVSAEGGHTADYYSVDALGNTEAMQRVVFAIDTAPPHITNLVPNGGVYLDGLYQAPMAPGFAVVLDSDPRNGAIDVTSHAFDARSGVLDVTVFAGMNGNLRQCSDGPHASSLFTCTWHRDLNDHGHQQLVVQARDRAFNTARVTIEVVG